jgi:propanol-preferring alcohol dehydrogenase
VRAVQFVRRQQEVELRDVPEPEPGAGQVLLKVEATGLCHSDLHIMDWEQLPLGWELPMTLGHEIAGSVASVGAGATGISEGERVLVYGPWGCGRCRRCALGAENLCQRRTDQRLGAGLGFDGGLAEYMVVPAARLLLPRAGLDAAHAAPLTDAALTPYHAIVPHIWRLVPGSTVLVIGIGGLGHTGVQLIRTLSAAKVLAVDPRQTARELALAAGADAALADGESALAELRAHTGGDGATLVLDFVGSDQTLRLAASAVGLGGHISIVGLGGARAFPIGMGNIPAEWTAGKPSWGTLPELHEVVSLAQAGRISIEVEEMGLSEAVSAYRRLRRGDVSGRLVLVP